MGYGRYDRGRDDRDPRSQRNSWNEDPSERYTRDRDDRGFLERAGEQISSWFGDDDDDRPRGQDRYERRPMSNQPDDRGARYRDEGYRRPYTGRMGRPPQGRDDEYRPLTGDYGRSAGPDMSREMGREGNGRSFDQGRGGYASGASGGLHDPHYSEWRNRQMSDLDRDYEEYRRENQSRFESDFSNWRSTRQSKRQMLGSIREHMQVIGSDEQPVGTVDKVRGDRIVLTANDSPDGQHHSVSCGMIDRVEGDRVILDKSAEEARQALGSETRDRALFERDDDREPGAHILNRSFSGTY